MCNITNQMIKEYKYSAATDTYHFLRQINVELIMLLWVKSLIVLHSVSVFSRRVMAQTTDFDVMTM